MCQRIETTTHVFFNILLFVSYKQRLHTGITLSWLKVLLTKINLLFRINKFLIKIYNGYKNKNKYKENK